MYRKINELTWDTVASLDPESVFYVLPVGSLEQHGRALPLGTDDLILTSSLEAAAGRARLQNCFLQLPNIHYGNSYEHMDFAGTVTLGCGLLAKMVESVMESMNRHGFRRLIVINSHGGNTAVFQAYAQEWEQKFGVRMYTVNFFGSEFFKDAQPMLQTSLENEIHGGELEASYISYAYPELFHKEMAVPERDVTVSLKEYHPGWLTRDLSPDNGLLGMASRADTGKGEKLYEYMAEKLKNYLELFDRM
ncbi:MAG: creatininase family protein [Eubacteriales bacterium]|nr:creatininase family protein [Eubacteriales bacterium]